MDESNRTITGIFIATTTGVDITATAKGTDVICRRQGSDRCVIFNQRYAGQVTEGNSTCRADGAACNC